MRVLIDECLNWRLARALTGHYAVSAQKMGWGGIQNGALLEKAAKDFDVLSPATATSVFSKQSSSTTSPWSSSTLQARSFTTPCR